MTVQFSETIVYQGKERSLESCPLEDYYTLANKPRPFISRMTALWRGYVGTWEIIDDRLYLININTTIGGGNQQITLNDIFPGYPERVFAHWFTGKLYLPDGQMGAYQVVGFRVCEPEREIIIDMKKGVVVKTSIQPNIRYVPQ
ncbi:hypothetical protein [Colwellia sp. MEBiC06753]